MNACAVRAAETITCVAAARASARIDDAEDVAQGATLLRCKGLLP